MTLAPSRAAESELLRRSMAIAVKQPADDQSNEGLHGINRSCNPDRDSGAKDEYCHGGFSHSVFGLT